MRLLRTVDSLVGRLFLLRENERKGGGGNTMAFRPLHQSLIIDSSRWLKTLLASPTFFLLLLVSTAWGIHSRSRQATGEIRQTRR